tara:strand:- start:399 stop:629 length:231 start_codon:yes stop_codon:yes gene_type:complete
MFNPAYGIYKEMEAFMEQKAAQKKPKNNERGFLRRNTSSLKESGSNEQPIEKLVSIVSSIKNERLNIKENKNAAEK